MGKGSGRGRVSQVISRYIDSLKWVKNPWKATETKVILVKPSPFSTSLHSFLLLFKIGSCYVEQSCLQSVRIIGIHPHTRLHPIIFFLKPFVFLVNSYI
jgi:hypothetical protein